MKAKPSQLFKDTSLGLAVFVLCLLIVLLTDAPRAVALLTEQPGNQPPDTRNVAVNRQVLEKCRNSVEVTR